MIAAKVKCNRHIVDTDSEFYRVWRDKNSRAVIQEFTIALRNAQDSIFNDMKAATLIQCHYRAYKVRCRMIIYRRAIMKMQQLIRGMEGRNRMMCLYKMQQDLTAASLREHHAANIQRIFRAWYSRKYRYSHSRRKMYIEYVVKQGEQVLGMMQEYASLQQEKEAEEDRENKEREFTALAGRLHHLVSTKVQRGVFNPSPYFMETPVAYDAPVEGHILAATRESLRVSNRARHTGLVPDLNGSLKVPLKGLKSKLSLQASAPYDAVQKEARLERRLNALKIVDQGKYFLAGGRTRLLDTAPAPLSRDEPFLDTWANPMLRRGEVGSFPSMSSKAFVSSVGGNKSAVLPNGLFDVIAEAQETGGVTQRHFGKSSRFGVANNADVRSSLPRPPLGSHSLLRSPNRVGLTTYIDPRARLSLLSGELAADIFASDSDEDLP